MSTNPGAQSNNSMPVSHTDLCWDGGDMVPQVESHYTNPGATPNLRGVEANTNESKGIPVNLTPHGTGNTHEDGVNGSAGTLDEAY